MSKYKILLAVIMFAMHGVANSDSHHEASPEFKSTRLTDSLYMLQGKGGNIALLKGEQGLLLIDSGYKNMSHALEQSLGVHGGLDKVAYLVNTHWHGDHTQGNEALGHSATIIAHENVRPRLLTKQEIKLFGMVSEPFPEHAVPSITYLSSMTLHFNDEAVKLVHYPAGHTDGDSIVFFTRANIVHMGDHFFSGMFPFVDVANGGNVLNMARNIQSVLSMIDNNTKVIPGHGPLSSKAELQSFHDMLVATSSEVRVLKEKGMSLDAIKQKGLSAKWKQWADGFISEVVWIGILYESLS